jgi:hypothetical protein
MINDYVEGISFIVKIRDEEDTLYESINSLSNLIIPHEIILILHLCTDKSYEIATKLKSENSHVKILFYDKEISKAGYENLSTDVDSEHSLVTYYNWCIKQKKYIWVFKWDADFIASLSLIKFLNENTWKNRDINYLISCKNDEMNGKELYLMCTLIRYVKYIFWEVPMYRNNSKNISLDENIYIYHNSKLSKLKKYWSNPTWFETENSEEANIVKNRIIQLNNDFGSEPKGLARCCNPYCNSYVLKIKKQQPSYVNFST